MYSSTTSGIKAALTPFLVLTTLLIAAGTQAAVYYVSPTGHDAGSGTALSAPFGTIAHAVQVAGPGDTVQVRGGTYREQVDLDSSRCGLPGKPLTIRSYKAEKVVIKGSDVVTGWTLDHGAVWKKSGWSVNSQQVFADGKLLQQIGAQDPFQTEIFNTNDGSGAPNLRLPPVGKDVTDVVPGSFYYDSAAHLLFCELTDHSDPNTHLMEASVRRTVLTGFGKSYVSLYSLTLMHCNGTSDGDYNGVVQTDGSHWTMDACTFQYGDFCGVKIGGTDHTIRNCRILDNGDVGVSLQGSDAAHNYGFWEGRPAQHILLDHLVISGNNSRHFDEAWNAGGIKAIPSVRDVTVRGCTVTDNNGPGIWFDTDYGTITIESNLAARNHAGIVYEISQPVSPDNFGAIIRNNRVLSNTGQGIYVSASQGAVVENNTCYRNDFDIVLHGMPRGGASGPMLLQNNVVRNNIVDGINSDIVLFSGPNASNNRLDSNFYVSRSAQITLAVTGTPNYNNSLMSITAARGSGYEAHGESGDPEWVNAPALDFRLRPGSPAAGKGWQPLSGVFRK